jgi:hypothetical protein
MSRKNVQLRAPSAALARVIAALASFRRAFQ